MNIKEKPDSYYVYKEIDLVKDRRLLVFVNIMSVAIAVLMGAIGLIIWIDHVTADAALEGILSYKWIFSFAGMIAYVFLHEFTHGIFMKHYSGIKPVYGFRAVFAYAGSDALFSKKQYTVIALSPVVILGLIIAVLNFVLSSEWFWAIWIIQMVNVSGAAGDIYVMDMISKMPPGILVKDTGTAMTFYVSKETVAEF
ncbi:MAG: DUF3267 domain-containing protein [Clostridia bacterium]|jgi:hypothetical protein